MMAMADRCALCDELDSPHRSLIRRFFPPAQPGVDENEAVEICDAVKKIFEWKCNGKRRFKIDKKVQVCRECGTCVGKLYASILCFDFLKKSESYIQKGLLRDQAEEDIQRYREQVQRKSLGISFGNVAAVSSDMSAVDTKPIVVGFGPGKKGVYELVAPDTPDEDEGSGGMYGDDLAMVDDEEGDPDYRRENTREKKVDVTKLNRLIRNMDETPTVVLGVDESPPSPRAASAPVVDLENKRFRCQLCPKGFGTNQGLRTHLLLTHEIGTKTKDHVCIHCGKQFFYEYLLKNHAKVHSNEKPVECAICPSRFKTKLALVHHQKNVHAASNRPFKCIDCGKAYKEARSLREHINITHNSAGPVFKCKYDCGSTTSRKRSMLSHLRRCRLRPGAAEEKLIRKIQRRSMIIKKEPSEYSEGTEVDLRLRCKWNCGLYFKNKKAEMRHNVYFCQQRPTRQHQQAMGDKVDIVKHEPQDVVSEPVQIWNDIPDPQPQRYVFSTYDEKM